MTISKCSVWSSLQTHKPHTAFTCSSTETDLSQISLSWFKFEMDLETKSRQRFWLCRKVGPQSLLTHLPSRIPEANGKIKSFPVTLVARAHSPKRGRLKRGDWAGGSSGSVGLWRWAAPANLFLHPGKAPAYDLSPFRSGLRVYTWPFRITSAYPAAPWSIRTASVRTGEL